MSIDPIAAIGARIERQLTAIDTRHRASDATKAHRAMNAAVPFVLPDGTSQTPNHPTSNDTFSVARHASPPANADIAVGATFRRKGVLSDVPMTVTRAGDGVVVAAFTDSAGSHEIAFDATEIDVVTKAPAVEPSPVVQFFPSMMDLGTKATSHTPAPTVVDSVAMPAATAVAVAAASAPTSVGAGSAPTSVTAGAAPTSMTAGSAPTSVAAASGATTVAALSPVAPATAPELPLPAGAIRLPDGTLQFGYAPTGGPIDRPPVVQPPVPAEFGVGATFRRKGVIGDVPMTVLRVGDGVLMATVTFVTDDGRREMAFIPDQLDLVTRAPADG